MSKPLLIGTEARSDLTDRERLGIADTDNYLILSLDDFCHVYALMEMAQEHLPRVVPEMNKSEAALRAMRAFFDELDRKAAEADGTVSNEGGAR